MYCAVHEDCKVSQKVPLLCGKPLNPGPKVVTLTNTFQFRVLYLIFSAHLTPADWASYTRAPIYFNHKHRHIHMIQALLTLISTAMTSPK